MPAPVGARIAAAAPTGWSVAVIKADTDSFGDGAQAPSAESMQAIVDAEAYLGFGMPMPLYAAARQLKWIHSATAGVASILSPEVRASDVIITNSAGLYGPPIAEHVLGGVIYLLRAFDIAGTLQRETRWDTSVFATTAARVREISECRVLVLGAGGIGSEVARRFTMLGADVTGIRRNVTKGIPEGFARVVGLPDADAELPRADILVLAAPLTEHTRTFLNAERLAMLPEGAIVCNVARGALLDEGALIVALERGRIRGAVLDVFAREPLASDSPLWHFPQVLLTPHVAGVSPGRFWDRLTTLFLDNWARYRSGEPLRNLVDQQAGY